MNPISLRQAAKPGMFAVAADVLSSGAGRVDEKLAEEVGDFLRLLAMDQLSSSEELQNAAALLRVAGRIGGVFRLRCRSAPGLTFFGAFAGFDADWAAEVEPVSLNGAGETPRQAFGACIGEGVEYLSQFRSQDARQNGGKLSVAETSSGPDLQLLMEWIGGVEIDASSIEWMTAIRLRDGGTVRLPACLAVRTVGASAEDAQRWCVGSGCAAGPSREAAIRGALFELVERDAVAMWWRGGRIARSIPVEALESLGAVEFLGRVRQGVTDRLTRLLVLSSDFGATCIAAVSFDREGRGFAGGYACHIDPVLAVRSAIREMCQMELGNDLVAIKRSRGAGLNEADGRHHRRLSEVDADDPRLSTRGAADLEAPGMLPADAGTAELVQRLAAAGFEPYGVDLSHEDFGIHVAKIVIPGMQPYPSTFQTPRLKAVSGQGDSLGAEDVDLF